MKAKIMKIMRQAGVCAENNEIDMHSLAILIVAALNNKLPKGGLRKTGNKLELRVILKEYLDNEVEREEMIDTAVALFEIEWS